MIIKDYLGDDYRDIILEDDDTPWGGVAHCDETLGEFMDSVGLIEDNTIDILNLALKNCGIKTL